MSRIWTSEWRFWGQNWEIFSLDSAPFLFFQLLIFCVWKRRLKPYRLHIQKRRLRLQILPVLQSQKMQSKPLLLSGRQDQDGIPRQSFCWQKRIPRKDQKEEMKITIRNPETFGTFSFPCGDDALENLMKQFYPHAIETRTIPVHEFVAPREFAFLNG